MKTLTLLVLALLTAAPVAAQESPRLDLKPAVALAVGSGLDLASTLYALHSTPGAVEGNPLLAQGGTPGLIGMKLGTTAGLIWAMTKISHQGHPTAAKVIGYVGGAVLSGVAVHNVRVR